MNGAHRRPGGETARAEPKFWFGLGSATLLFWSACGGQSVVYEDDQGNSGDTGVSGDGPYGGGGVAVTNGFGGSSVPTGGVVATGGDGFGATPSGGTGALGGVGPAGTGSGGIVAGSAGFGGIGVAGDGFAGAPGGAGFGGRGRGMGGRFGAGGMGPGRGGREGRGGRPGRGMGGFGGLGGFSGVAGSGGAGGSGGFGPNPLDGFAFFTPCNGGMVSGASCVLRSTCSSTDPSFPGIHSTDATVTMPGAQGLFYDMTVHVQGLVESKSYTGGRDQDAYAPLSPADGLYLGGAPVSSPASVYLVRVASPARDYFLNSISPPSMSSVAPPSVIDYRATIRVEGGTSVRLMHADSDCTILRNCGSPTSSTECNPVTVPNLVRGGISQPYDGQFVLLVVDSVTLITP
ncbi:MAG TPA: hypothetical protein VF103_13370 [Polyangiaceae bacterium]